LQHQEKERYSNFGHTLINAGVLVNLTHEEAGKRWNDAELAARKPITALQTKKDESGLLHSIRARYGPKWAQWREISPNDSLREFEWLEADLSSGVGLPKSDNDDDGTEATLDLGLDAIEDNISDWAFVKRYRRHFHAGSQTVQRSRLGPTWQSHLGPTRQ